MEMTGRAARQVEEYRKDPLPKECGSRKMAIHENGRYQGLVDGAIIALHGNKANRSRTYKKNKVLKTAGRNPEWMDLI